MEKCLGLLLLVGILVSPRLIADALTVEESSKIEKQFEDLRYQLHRLKQRVLEYHNKCDVNDGDHCFFGIFVGLNKMNQEAANLACEKYGAQPANIYTEEQYLEVMHYLRRWIAIRIDDGGGFTIKIGMTVEPKSQIVYLSDGSEAPFVRWRKDYPKPVIDYTGIALSVRAAGSVYNGMLNNKPNDANFGVLCEVII